MKQTDFLKWRFGFVLLVLIVGVVVLVARVVQLSVYNQTFLKKQGDERVLRLVKRPAFRGMILDRHGYPLAVSTAVVSIWVNPMLFTPASDDWKQLVTLLQLDAKVMKKQLAAAKRKKREFFYLKRNLPPDLAHQITALKVPGLYAEEAYRRYYPEGETTAQLLGVTNIDDQGQEGLELAYNEWLAGQPEKKWVIQDRLGRTIADMKQIQMPVRGKPIKLSIDRRIQYLAYRSLMEGVYKNQAVSGSIVVLDVSTGEVLALTNYPSFNPNTRSKNQMHRLRNLALTDLFEPGSTIKAFSVARALESGRFTPETMVDTTPIRVGRKLIKDEHSTDEKMSVTDVLKRSSNVGAARMMLSLPPDQFWALLHNVGFGESTGIGFPGEQDGVLIKQNPWKDIEVATLAYGYGLSVTTLQLARAYLVIAKDGVKIPLSLFPVQTQPLGEQVIAPHVAQQMRLLLEEVVAGHGGTGDRARVPGFRIAGKTGTSWVSGKQGYTEKKYTSSFVGIAPASRPTLLVAVVINNPRGHEYYGGSVSGPVFEKTMEGTLRILGVSPDNQAVENPS